MANYAAKVTEVWNVQLFNQNLYSYGGEYFALGSYNDGSGMGMFKSHDAGLVKMSNSGVTWTEQDIPNAPRNAWLYDCGTGAGPAFTGVLTDVRSCRSGNVVYFAAFYTSVIFPGSTFMITGSYDLATNTWGPQGTDDATNPSSVNAVALHTMQAIGANDLLILWEETTIPAGPGSNTFSMFAVRYNAGTWGTPFTVASGDVPTVTYRNGYGQIFHEAMRDYAHFVWGQDAGPGAGPGDAVKVMYGSTYTISSNTLAAPSIIISDPGAPMNNGASIDPDQICPNANLSGDGFTALNWSYHTFEMKYIQVTPLNSATPTYNTGTLYTDEYEHDTGRVMVLNNSGTLTLVHGIGTDNSGSPGITDVLPQIAYRTWNGATWSAEGTAFTETSVMDFLSRTSADAFVGIPDAGNPYNYGFFGVHAPRHPVQDRLVAGASSLTSEGFVVLLPVEWDKLFTPAANIIPLYFMRPAPAVATGGGNHMWFGLGG